VVNVFAQNAEAMEKAVNMIQSLVAEAVEGTVYSATVKRVMEYGAFVEILPGIEGLLHISQYSHERIASISDYLKVGDKVDVLYSGKDKNGRLELSHKALLPRDDYKKKKHG
jgi:polyribonucleotide nucleotidyltransferase